MQYLSLTLNGRTVDAANRGPCRGSSTSRVRSPITPTLDYTWYDGRWRVIYAPDFAAGLQQTWYADSPYRLLLDVTDLANPAAENTLGITNHTTVGLAQQLNGILDLVVGNLAVEVKDVPSPTLSQVGVAQHRLNRGEPGAGPAPYQAALFPRGAIQFDVGGRRVVINSSFTFRTPASICSRGAASRPAGLVTRPHLEAVDARGTTTRLHRELQATATKLAVVDRITNLHADQPVGLMVRHAAALAGLEPEIRLAGDGDPAVNEVHAPPNPSVHIGLGEVGLGILAEDDVLRNHAVLFFEPESGEAGLRDEQLMLGPGETRALRWSVYPVASPEYYDFINLARADWGANLTVDGAWMFFSPEPILAMPSADLAARIQAQGIRYACLWGGWVDRLADPKRIGFGTEVLSDYWADYRRRIKESTAKLHAAAPGLKVLIYYDSQRDTYADAGERYPDSKLIGPDGGHHSTDWGGRYSTTWSMVATADNSYGRRLLEVVDAYFTELGADGLYWDEMEATGYGAPLLTYGQPDGVTCRLDPRTFTIERQMGNQVLLGEGHRLAVIARARAHGGTVMGNSPCFTRGMLTAGVQRMVEIQHNDTWVYQGHLSTPLGYASGRKDFGNLLRALDFGTLLVGTQTDYPYQTGPYLYPFTPVELHPGYLLGLERIITRHSGRYGWPGETVPCTVYRFNVEGKLADRIEAVAGPERLAVEVGEGELVVLVRR